MNHVISLWNVLERARTVNPWHLAALFRSVVKVTIFKFLQNDTAVAVFNFVK